jgi:hypothetical protein
LVWLKVFKPAPDSQLRANRSASRKESPTVRYLGCETGSTETSKKIIKVAACFGKPKLKQTGKRSKENLEFAIYYSVVVVDLKP